MVGELVAYLMPRHGCQLRRGCRPTTLQVRVSVSAMSVAWHASAPDDCQVRREQLIM
jgi:hypothetical protein